MPGIDDLTALVGSWAGHTSLWLEPGTPAFESPTTAAVSTVAGGTVVTLDYTWTHEGEPQDGRLLVAITDEGVHMAWCDSFHTGAGIMDFRGEAEIEPIEARGTYGPADEPWGWRIELAPSGADRFALRMYNILPASMGRTEALAVQADYTRA